MSFDYDFAVIGAGSGGVRAARMAAGFGARTLVIESRYLGGTCVNVGCVPKKLYVYGAQFSDTFALANSFGWQVGQPQFDWPTLRDNKSQEIARLNGIYERMLENAGVTIMRGTAQFVDRHTLQVGDRTVTAKDILIATGGWPHVPDIPGKEHALDSNQFFDLPELPKQALVVGGGYIAVEFAGILNGLGVDTSILYRGPLFLRGFDQTVREFVKEEISKKGIQLLFNTNVKAIEPLGDELSVTLDSGVQRKTNAVIYATGRRPLSDNLNLDAVGVKTVANGAIEVNKHYRTNVDNIYAVGDVIDRVALTPVALAEGMCVAQRLFNNNSYDVDYEAIPTAVFCQPNIGTVGYTEEQAVERFGDDIAVFQSDFKAMKYTMGGSESRTLMKLIVQKSTDKVLGAHMVGDDAGEIIQGIGIAIKAGATKAVFDTTIGIHPTSAEEFVTMRQPVER